MEKTIIKFGDTETEKQKVYIVAHWVHYTQ